MPKTTEKSFEKSSEKATEQTVERTPDKSAEKVAVVLFNLGGPDRPDSVRPFLFNLFHDPAIIRIPQPFRWLLAQLISRQRAPIAREIYDHLGGGSPLVPNTQAQIEALEQDLNNKTGTRFRGFMCMRYWHPRADATASHVAAWEPDRIILLPLYPQFSSTTSASSLREWHKMARIHGLEAIPSQTVCCYPHEDGFIHALTDLMRQARATMPADAPLRVLFSAHGLPESIIKDGDPYQWQCEQTAQTIAQAAGIDDNQWVLCYQSRVGPKKWIEPSTEDEIQRASRDGVALMVVPIAFVSDHSETLVELDIEYKELAENSGIKDYVRVPVVGIHPDFIAGLGHLVRRALEAMNQGAYKTAPGGTDKTRLCPREWSNCPCRPG
ncbi:MAG: ferrochelatase [Pseudomonadota bacterium]